MAVCYRALQVIPMDDETIDETWKAKPVNILRDETRSCIVDYLNRDEKEKGRLLAKIGLSQPEIEEIKTNTDNFIDIWSRRQDLNPTIYRLIEVLQRRDLRELIADVIPIIEEDIEAYDKYMAHQEKRKGRKSRGPKTTDRQTSDDYLTVPDVFEGGNSKFDALLCGSENQRIDQISERLKGSGVKVCDLRRDILPGLATYPTGAIIIDNRAPTLLLMIDKDMLNDQACSFQMISAHYLDPDARFGRWIPIKLEADVEVPTYIKHGEILDLSTDEKQEENWMKLLSSIKGSGQRNSDTDDVAQKLFSLKTQSI